MIAGAHTIVFAEDADAARAFFRDVLEFPNVDGGDGWLIFARHELKNALISLSPGWSEGQQMNTIEPVPAVQASRDGDLLFTLGHIAKGKHYRLFLQFQVNPTNVAWHRPANVALYDSGALVLRIHHTLTIYP